MIGTELARSIAAPSEFEFDGKKFEAKAYTLSDWGRAANYLKEKRQDEILRMVSAQKKYLPHDTWKELWNEAFAKAQSVEITPEDFAGGVNEDGSEKTGWIDTPEGVAYATWQMVEKVVPGQYTLDRVTEIVGEMAQHDAEKFERLKADRDEAAQVDAMSKNSESPADARPGEAEVQGETRDTTMTGAPTETGATATTTPTMITTKATTKHDRTTSAGTASSGN